MSITPEQKLWLLYSRLEALDTLLHTLLAELEPAKDSDTPETCPTCGATDPRDAVLGVHVREDEGESGWEEELCSDPFHTQPSDTEDERA